MKSKSQKTIALTCLVSLIIASFAIAEEKTDSNRRPRNRRDRYQQDRDRMTDRMQGEPGMGAQGGYRGRRGQGYGRGNAAQPMGGTGGMRRGGYGAGMGAGMGGGMGQGMPMGGGMMGGARGMGSGQGDELIPAMIRQRLNLSADQARQIDSIQQKQMKTTMELSRKNESLKNELEDAVNKGNKEAIVDIARKMGNIIGETALLRVSGKESLKTILDETQLERLKKFNQQMQDRREQMKKMMQQRTGGRGEHPPMQDGTRHQMRGRREEEKPMTERQKRMQQRKERQELQRKSRRPR